MIRAVILACVVLFAVMPAIGQPLITRENAERLTKADDLVNQGIALLHANKDREAADRLTEALRLAPELPAAHYDLALALAKLGKMPEAIQEAKTAVSLKDDVDSFWLTLGGLYQATGQLQQALDIYRDFQTRFPNSTEAPKLANLARGLEGEIARQQGSSRRSSDYYAEVVKQGVYRWPQNGRPILIYVPPGTGVDGFLPWMPAVLKQAFLDWATATRGKVAIEFVDRPVGADIHCSWLSDPTKFANPAEAGEGQIFTGPKGIVRATVKLLTLPSSPNLPQTQNRFRIACLHEVGHVMGLQGHSADPGDIMFSSTSTISDQWRSLSARDNATIEHLYAY
jgi:tetratricopeptide (TPR) repeat protein